MNTELNVSNKDTDAYHSKQAATAGETDIISHRKLTYAYDGLGRVKKRSFYGNVQSKTPTFQNEYRYLPGGYGANSATTLVQSILQAGRKYEYWYNKPGSVIREHWKFPATESGILTFNGEPILSQEGEPLTLNMASMTASYDITYAYDALGQLTWVNNGWERATWTYAYDQGGNILEKRRYAYTRETDLSRLTPEESIPYSYADANWKDKLTAYNGKPITHDEIGNPLSYDGWSYTWKAGRMLYSMQNDTTQAEFTYDHTGLRVKKTVNNVDTLYTLNGKKITYIRKGASDPNDPGYVKGSHATRMHFFYDAQGRATIVQYNRVDYAYLHNLQGDVTGLMDMNGAVVVEYRYDAWGRPTGTWGSLAETLGRDNPFRYRGYVWDEETGLYYLCSRYYDPEWGRFVNADVFLGNVGTILGHNVFAYCANNPVNLIDPDGMSSYSARNPTSHVAARTALRLLKEKNYKELSKHVSKKLHYLSESNPIRQIYEKAVEKEFKSSVDYAFRTGCEAYYQSLFPPKAVIVPATIKTVYAPGNNDPVRVRSTAEGGRDDNIKVKLPQGTQVEVISNLSSYFFVRFINPVTGWEDEGYIHEDYLE